MNIIDEIGKKSLKKYLEMCSEVSDIDIDLAYDITLNFIKHHRGQEVSVNSIRKMKDLEEQWYNSLDKNFPDYSVYNDPYYFCEVWLCWINYSRRYIKEICRKESLFNKSIVDDMTNMNTIVDLGCGFGYTTAALKQVFTDCDVYGTNIKGSQYKIASRLGKEYNFDVIEDIKGIKADLVFASEYFEHFERPVEHLQYIIDTISPEYFLIANTFNGKAIGHFNSYKHIDEIYNGKKISILFNKTLRSKGYYRVNTNCWNNRPGYWKKNSRPTIDSFLNNE